MKKIFCFLLLSFFIVAAYGRGAKEYSLLSPDGRLCISLKTGQRLTYCVAANGKQLIEPSEMALVLRNGEVLGHDCSVISAKSGSKQEWVDGFLYRQRRFYSEYNELVIRFKGDYGLQVRAYNDGVAYRFTTAKDDSLFIVNETVEFNVSGDPMMTLPYHKIHSDKYATSFEAQYSVERVSDFRRKHDGGLSYLPLVLDYEELGKLILLESDVEDYPGLFVNYNTLVNGLVGELPGYPTAYRQNYDGDIVVTARDSLIARTLGKRTFPWRIIGYADSFAQLPVNNMVWALAAECRLDDVSWIKPGHSAWEWWNNWSMWGVDFPVGINTPTYKYMIDFAHDFGLQYVTVDAGWNNYGADSTVLKSRGDFDVKEVCRYASQKGVGIILWLTGDALDRELEEACRYYSGLGVKGFKLDYHDRQDQRFMQQEFRIAQIAAKYHLLVDFHGMHVPKGINRTYPNVINFEAVFGLEQLKWTDKLEANMPRHDVLTVFLRQVAGPHDYTPGAMINSRRSDFRSINGAPMSQGSRAHQVATYICFDAPLSMLADSPTRYMEEATTTRFISALPTVFDSTFVLQSEYEKYVVMGREKDGDYFVGGLNDWDARTISLDLSFLPQGEFEATFFKDGPNANNVAQDFSISCERLSQKDRISIPLASGGGFAAVFKRCK